MRGGWQGARPFLLGPRLCLAWWPVHRDPAGRRERVGLVLCTQSCLTPPDTAPELTEGEGEAALGLGPAWRVFVAGASSIQTGVHTRVACPGAFRSTCTQSQAPLWGAEGRRLQSSLDPQTSVGSESTHR